MGPKKRYCQQSTERKCLALLESINNHLTDLQTLKISADQKGCHDPKRLKALKKKKILAQNDERKLFSLLLDFESN